LLKGAALLGFAGAALPRRGWASEDKQLNFYNWDTYTGETTLSTFTERTGIEVSLDLYASNEELFAKLNRGNPGYDVIVPGNEMVETMRAVGLLRPLDHGRVPHIANIDAHFRAPEE
jgi:spermidine/putrescine transport system substrate-binding protein